MNNVVKNIMTILLFIPYVLTLGAISFEAVFPDGSYVRYNGWLI